MMAWAVTAASACLRIRVWVAGSVDYAVHAVGRQSGRLVLRRHPGGVTPTAGCQDDQWLVAEAGERCSLVFRCIGLEELVDGAAKTGRGGDLRAHFVRRLRGQGAVAAAEADQTPHTQPSRGRGQHGGTSQDVVRTPALSRGRCRPRRSGRVDQHHSGNFIGTLWRKKRADELSPSRRSPGTRGRGGRTGGPGGHLPRLAACPPTGMPAQRVAPAGLSYALTAAFPWFRPTVGIEPPHAGQVDGDLQVAGGPWPWRPTTPFAFTVAAATGVTLLAAAAARRHRP